MSDIYSRVKDQTRLLEKIELFIPGFRGYKEKELRRESDRLLREGLLSRLENSRNRFKDLMPIVAQTENPVLYEMYNKALAIFDRVVGKLRTADYGYTGFFDAIKVKEETLDRLLEYDAQLVDLVASVDEAVSASWRRFTDPQGMVEGLNALVAALTALEQAVARREEVIRGFA